MRWFRCIQKEQAVKTAFEYIEVDYNRTRSHGVLGYLSPSDFE
ncbi:IS3 family transposase [Vibrio owensii]|nr:IS3 family transposase [Vibrio owensii]